MSGETDRTLGIRLRAARRRRGLTQAQLAGPGYSVAYVSRIESGERTPSPEALASFAGRLGVSPASLLSPLDEQTEATLESLRVTVLRLLDQTDWAEARAVAGRLLDLATGAGSRAHEADALRALGEIEERIGSPEEALVLYEKAAVVRSPNVTRDDAVDMTVRLARTHRRLGDLGTSSDLLERALADLAPDSSLYPGLMARLCLHLAATCFERGDIARSRRVGLEGIEHARAAGDTRTLASALWAAAPPMAAADPARALSLIRRAGTLYAELGLTLELGRLHAQMGVVALQAGDTVTARTALDRAVELMGSAATPSALSTILVTRADMELQEGNMQRAAALARQTMALAEHIEPLELARAQRVLGEALLHDDPEAAERELRRAIELFTSAGAQRDSARCFRSLGE
ncbi:MAG: helix-turn-helix domain-containing protein, partial [Actinomycetota bacterium]